VPLYEYKCLKCGRHTEKIENVSGPHLHKCPHCSGRVELMISAPAIQFKGSGWYVTDYAGKSGRDGGTTDDKASGEKAKGDSKEAGSKDSAAKESASKDSGAKETKSEKKPAEKPGKKK
jgi:putative FmdB family regulatory protein